MKEIVKPVIILGNIRSGTTILYNIMSVHPQLCWFSNYSNRFPGMPQAALLHRLLDLPVLGTRFKIGISRNQPPALPCPWPSEGDNIYHNYCGFGKQKDGIERVLTEQMSSRLRGQVRMHLKYTGKSRFVTKQTANNRRIEIIDEVFPDALYIHIIRDGRAVANSTLKVPWWDSTNIWWLGYTPAEWKSRGREPAELAALYWRRNVEEIRRQGDLLGGRYLEIRYEDLVKDVRSVIENLLDFCELDKPPEYMELIPQSLPDRNRKWRSRLSREQVEAVQHSVGEFLEELGYTDS